MVAASFKKSRRDDVKSVICLPATTVLRSDVGVECGIDDGQASAVRNSRIPALFLMLCLNACVGPDNSSNEISPQLAESVSRFRSEVETRELQTTEDDMHRIFSEFFERHLDRKHANHAFMLDRTADSQKPPLTVDRVMEVLGQPSNGTGQLVGPRGIPVLRYRLSGARVLRYVAVGYDTKNEVIYAEYSIIYL